MTHRISAREANHKFSDILGRASRGENVIITRRGEPVAQLVRYGAASPDSDHAAAWDRLLSIVETGLPLGGGKFDRDAAHDR